LIGWILAASAAPPPESAAQSVRPEEESHRELTVFALFQTRLTADDLVSSNPLLDGQVVGRLGGTNGIVVDSTARSAFAEQRVAPFFTWSPLVLGGDAALTAAFEVDFAFGDAAYGTGGNVGGGFGADQVNLQTRRLHASFFPHRGPHRWHVVLGLQFVSDSVSDPTATGLDGLLRSGGRMAFFGSEAAGITVYGRWVDDWGTRLRYRLGSYTLIEQGRSLPDDVWLTMADVEVRPLAATSIGGHLWFLQDRSGAAGVLSPGPTGAMWELQGGPSLDPYDGYPPPAEAPVDADLLWFVADAGYNAALDRGPLGLSGYVAGNVGRIYAPIVHDDGVMGWAAEAEVRMRYAQGEGSVLRGSGIFSSGDDADPQRYTGVVTGNAYGIAGAPMPTLGTLLLFPDARAINRMVSIVSDLSASGQGLLGGAVGLGYDVIPSRVGVGGWLAGAVTARGQPWGTEVGGRISGKPLLGVDLSLRAATVAPGVASELGGRPWMVTGAVDWLVF
jgi:hypothetical protein